jgi:Tol biopolymer transport system component/pimeloyl-ACP methyl ester carboxylesterase
MVEAVPRVGSEKGRLTQWFQVSTSWLPSFTHDGKELLYLSDATGLPQAWRVDLRGGAPRRFRESSDRVGRADACPTRPRAVLAQDSGGNEVWQLELCALDAGTGASRAARRPLTADPKVMNLPGRWMSDGHHYLFSSNARDPRFFDVYRLDVDGWSPPERIWTGDAHQEATATRGSRIVVARYNTYFDADLFLLDHSHDPVHLNPHTGELTVSSASVGPDGVYVTANPGREFLAVFRYPFDGSEPELVREFSGDVELVRVSPDGNRIAAVLNKDGWTELHLLDRSGTEDRRVVVRPRGGWTEELVWQPDGAGFAFDSSWPSGREIFHWSSRDDRVSRLTHSPSPPPAKLSEPRLGSARSSDGLTIPYWDYVPARRAARGTLLSIHGGPEGQARPMFDPWRAAFLSEGWRVIEPNVRGSLGYGRTYFHLDDVRKRMDSVRDVRDLVEALRRGKSAERAPLGVFGGSYGGFMVLSCITTYPEYWGAAVEYFGISNFVTFLERTAAYRRALREAEYGSLAQDRDFLQSISPVNHLDRIRTPLYVFHGRNDPRVPIHEAEQIVRTLRDSGRPVEHLYFENEGHGFSRRENQVESARRTADFFARHLARPEARKPPKKPASPRARGGSQRPR